MARLLKWGLILTCILAVFSLVYPLLYGEVELRDSSEYLHLSKNLSSQGFHYAGDPDKTVDMRLFSKRPMGYALFHSFAAAQNNVLLKFLQIALIFLLLVVGIQILILIGHQGSISLFVLLFALSIGLFLSSQWIMADLLLSCLIALAIYYFILYSQKEAPNDFKRFALILSFAVLLKPVMLPAALFLGMYGLLHAKKNRAIAAYAILPALLVLGVFIMNKQLTGKFHYSSISTINKVYYNAKLTIAAEYGLDSATHFTEGQVFETPRTKEEFREYSKNLNQRANSTLLNHLPSYALIHSLGMLKSILDPGRFELYSFFHQNKEDESLSELIASRKFDQLWNRLSQAPMLTGLLLLLFAVAVIKLISLFFLDWAVYQKHWILPFCLLYFVFLAGPIGAFRFAIPCIIPYLLLSSIGLKRILLKFQKGSIG